MKLKNCLFAAFFSALILSILFSLGFLSNIQLKLADNLYGGKTPLDSINIIAIDDKSLQEIGRWPWDRDVFAYAINYLDQAKVIGIDVAFFETSKNDTLLEQAVKKANVVLPVEFTSFAKEDSRVVGKRLLEPIDALKGTKVGYINIITDDDGITRSVNMDLSEEYDNFAHVVFKEFWKKELKDKPKRFLVNFAGKPGAFKIYSMTDIINKRVPADAFKNKLVLIGATAPDLHDDYFVPTSKGKAMPGVEIHANTIQTLINKDFLKEQSKSSVILLIFLFSIILALIFYKSKRIAAIITPLIILGYLFASVLVFDKGIIMNLVYVPVAVVAAFVSEIILSYRIERKAKIQLKSAFSKYVSPAVMDEVIKDPEKLKLGGVRKDVTVFFSDIRGFTSISEKLSPEKLVHILNEYLTAMTDIIMKHNGVVDKYIGDAIMAFWGAPLPQEDHAEMACSTSLDMIKKLEELKEKWKEQDFPEIRIGVGLNSGPAVIGNMGSYDRFDYTAMGDTINLGSRLEGLTKQYKVNIIISDSTKVEIKNKFITRKLDLVRVKGKKKPITIYELVCRKEDLTIPMEKKIKTFENALNFYLKRRWRSAIAAFKEVDDFASREFIKRCESFRDKPPEKDWDDVWVMKSK